MDYFDNLSAHLPVRLQLVYQEHHDAIQSRLREFSKIHRNQWFYELCYCILTPQSKAVSADAVIAQLELLDFQNHPTDVLYLLRDKHHYIRFHNVKHHRLHMVQKQWAALDELIHDGLLDPSKLREDLVSQVSGFGYKEASHFLRNIGVGGLAILDRHILSCLEECGVIPAATKLGSRNSYMKIENILLNYSHHIGVDANELDLIFWASKAGEVRK